MDDGERSELARGEQPRQLGVDAGEALLGVGSGVAGGAAEGRRGGEEALGVLGFGELVAVVGGEELRAEPVPALVGTPPAARSSLSSSPATQLRAVRVDADPQAAVRVRLAQVGEQRLAAGRAGEGEGRGDGDLAGARVTTGRRSTSKAHRDKRGCSRASHSTTRSRKASASRHTSSTSAADTTPVRS